MNRLLRNMATAKNFVKTIPILILFLALSGMAFAQDLVPAIEIQPGTTVEVGEEVFFSAASTTYPDATLLKNARYEWDFGDGYSFKYERPIYDENHNMSHGGIAHTHYYMKPGDYTVTVTVKIWTSWTPGFTAPIGDPIVAKTVSRVIHVSGEAPIAGFEIQRANFHNRLAQYLYVQIPSAYRANQTTLRVTLVGAKGSQKTLLSKTSLAAEECAFLDHKTLAQDDYVVNAELFDGSGKRIPGGIWRDKFSKRYDGLPKAGIDENNSFCLNGQPFFLIGNFMTDYGLINNFVDQAGINTLSFEGYDTAHTPDTWGKYLEAAKSYNLIAMGPGRGDYNAGGMGRFNYNVQRMAQYVKQNKDHTAMFAWTWQDEPNMGGWTEKVYPPTLGAWAYVCHAEDPMHLVFNGYIGQDWSRYYGTGPNDYDYLSSAKFFGGKKWVPDIFSWDQYPIAGRAHPCLNFTDRGPYSAYLDSVDRTLASNKNLVPFIPYLQPCGGAVTPSWGNVTEEQVYMETWLNVIHGAKGIMWFSYFQMSTTGRWAAMKKFADQIKVLAPVVLQPAPSRTVSDDANAALKRVDTMIREKDDAIYVFSARVTEPDPVTEVKYQGVEPESITVNFTVSGLSGDAVADVVDEGRQVIVADGRFQDTFEKNSVHIYRILKGTASSTAGVTTGVEPPRNLRIVE